MYRLVAIVTHPSSARVLMQGQLAFLNTQGFEVTVVASPGHDLQVTEKQESVKVVGIPMEREISPGSDIRALFLLWRLLCKIRPHIVNAGTPKAGLLGMIAALLAGVPVRIYTLRGLRLETSGGMKRRLLALTERIAAACAHRIMCNSETVRRCFVELGLAPENKTCVLGSGSSNGVNLERFTIGEMQCNCARELRRTLGIPDHAPVVGFVGRLTKDKGIEDIVQLFDQVARQLSGAYLLVLGNFEAGDPVSRYVMHYFHNHPRIIHTGFVSDPESYYPMMDVLAFPSYREGFPNVPLEAAACGLPVAAYRATGTMDAIIDGVTGILVSSGDVVSLTKAVCTYLNDEDLRKRHGEAGRERVERLFKSEVVWQELLAEYRRLLNGVPV